MLLREKLIRLSLVRKILRWRHTSFNVHSRVRARDRSQAERIGKYMIRPLLSLERLSFDESEGKVCYQCDKQGSEEEQMDYLEFIIRVTSHIPDKEQVMIRYYGLWTLLQRSQEENAQGSRRSIQSPDLRRRREVCALERLGGDDQQSLRVIDELHPIQQVR